MYLRMLTVGSCFALGLVGCAVSATGQGSTSVAANSPSSPLAPVTPVAPVADEARALAWAWTSVGCFVGGPWSELLGARPEDRVVAHRARCREVVTGPLAGKADDDAALDAVRGLDAAAVAKVVDAIDGAAQNMGDRRKALIALVKASADASREAMSARRAAEAIRGDLAVKDGAQATADLRGNSDALTAKAALAALYGLGTDEARLVALVLAADHLESVRGLSPAAKSIIASPAFDVVLGQPLPAGALDPKHGAWLDYVRDAAKAAGHPVDLGPGAATVDLEKAAFAGVVAGFADRFETLAPKLQGAPRAAADAYVKRLRAAVADFDAKAKAKVDAKKTTDDAAKKASEDPKKKK